MSENKTVLLVDDDEDFLLQHKMLIESCGYIVTTAQNRSEAEQLLTTLKPSIAILDLMMEQADDGFVLAHHIRQIDSSIPIILITAVTSETGLKFGVVSETDKKWVKADVVLSKPVRFEQLKSELERLLS
jgi:CheY-like chemotaxis protein